MEPVLSVIVPVFNEEAIVPELHSRLTAALGVIGEPYEIIFSTTGPGIGRWI